MERCPRNSSGGRRRRGGGEGVRSYRQTRCTSGVPGAAAMAGRGLWRDGGTECKMQRPKGVEVKVRLIWGRTRDSGGGTGKGGEGGEGGRRRVYSQSSLQTALGRGMMQGQQRH